jgi:predicted kinase
MENIKKKHKRVFVMCGPAGAGKSTWVIKQMAPITDLYISRDNIRFMLLKENDDYFAKENQVKKMFYDAIANATSESEWENIFIDATHLTTTARFKTLMNIANGVEIIAVSFEVPIETAIERNNQRVGRALVPEKAIRNMYASYKIPALYEGFREIWHIDAAGNIVKERDNNE